MAKDTRRILEKYRGEYTGIVLKRLCPNINRLLEAIETNLLPSESIEVYEWVADWYYVVIRDDRILGHPQKHGCGFTVNIKRDLIMWNNDYTDNLSGGNCFLRSRRWKNFVNKQWKGITKEMIHFYEFVSPTK